MTESFAVVHNGIIENYLELRKFLEEKGIKFISDTDTEVVPNLINYFYTQETDNSDLKILRAVKKACEMLIGSFSLEILSKYMPNNMIVIRKDSPLVIGKGHGENYIASDIPAILSYTKDFYLLNNFEYVILSRDNIKFYDNNLNEINKDSTVITWDAMAADKGGYEDYMIKGIYPNKNKRGGAYSGGSYDTYPYVLLNYQNKLNDYIKKKRKESFKPSFPLISNLLIS